jgi:hypothetical protein
MSLPSDLVIMLDGSKASAFRLNTSGSRDGGFCDTVSLAATLAQGTAANQPTYDHYACATGPGLILGGSGAPLYTQPTWMVSGGTVTLGANWTLSYFGCADVAGCFYEWGNVATGQGVQLKDGSLKIVGTSSTMTATFTSLANNTDSYFELQSDGTIAGTTLTRNGVAVTLSTSGSNPGAITSSLALTLGSDHGQTAPLTGTCGFYGYDLRKLSSGETANVLAYLSANPWYLPPASQPVSATLVELGDSIAGAFLTGSGSLLTPAYAFTNIAALMLGSRIAGGTANNFAVGGVRLTVGASSAKAQWDTGGGLTAATAAAGKPVIATCFCGINDVSALAPVLSTMTSTATTIAGFASTVVSDIVSGLGGISHGSGLPHLVVPCCITTGVQEAQAGCVREINRQERLTLPALGTSSAQVVVFDVGLGSDIVVGQTIGIENGYQTAPAFNVANVEHPSKAGHRHMGGKFARFLLSLGY